MRKVEFLEVGMENYGPYIDPMVLNFQADSLTLITGPNGIGKTMSIDAIPFTLYGVTSKGAKGDDVVNNVVGKNCRTWVKFNINDVPYSVTRYHKYTKLGNTVLLNVDGVDTKKGQKEVLPEVERLLCPKKSFMNTLMFGQKIKDFFTDLIDSDKKEIFRKILDLDSYTKYYQNAKTRLDALKESLNNLRTQIGIEEGLLANAKEEIILLKNKKKEFEENKKETLKELKQSLDKNNRLLKQWEDNHKELASQEINIEKITQILATLESKLLNIETKGEVSLTELDSKKTAKISELQGQARYAQIEIQDRNKLERDQLLSSVAGLRSDLQKYIDEVTEMKHKLDLHETELIMEQSTLEGRNNEIQSEVLDAKVSICPLCEQDVTDKTVELLTSKMTKANDKIKMIVLNLEKLKEKRANLNKMLSEENDNKKNELKKIEDKISELQNNEEIELKKIDDKLSNAIEKVNNLALREKQKIRISFENDKKSIQEKIHESEKEKKEQEKLANQLKEIETTMTNINSQISSIEREIEYHEKQTYDETQLKSYIGKEVEHIAKLKTLKEEVEKSNELYEILDFWKTGFSSSGIPSMLIDEAIPYMNLKVSEYLDKLTNGRYIVSFDTMATTKSGEFRDKISVNVIDTYTRANSRIQLSGGQTRIIDIATILTLGDLQSNIQDVSFNIMLFDEIFDSLDEDNVGYVSKVLKNLKLGKSIYLISHRHEEQLEPDEVLSLTG